MVAVLGNPKVAREITDRILSNTRLQPFSENFVKEYTEARKALPKGFEDENK